MPDTSLSLKSDVRSRPEAVSGPITVIFNAGAGANDNVAARRVLEEALGGAGRGYQIVEPSSPETLDRLCERIAPRVAGEGGMLVAAGGDGTVSTVAAVACAHRLPLGVLPLGTFNYFARDNGVPTDVEVAARTLIGGRIATVGAGEVNGHLFINNASIGLYTHLIRQRELAKARFGRHRLVAALSAAGALLRGQRSFSIHLGDGSASGQVQTSMLFVACNTLQLEALGLGIAGCSRAGTLGVVLLKPTRFAERLRLLARVVLKSLDEDPALASFCADGMEVRSRRRSVNIVVDGELRRLRTPLAFRSLPDALKLVVPREAA
jgi:diacylglycerol kinase family enzyme